LAQRPTIAIGSDHAGFPLKEKLRAYLTSQGYEVSDVGTVSTESVDYPDYAEDVSERVVAGEADFGVLVCGTGIGMAIAANKVPGIRAANCGDTVSAQLSRAHNNANVLTMGGRMTDEVAARKILDIWLTTPFEGNRHQRRVNKISEIDLRHHSEKTK
jgi:ribose 5-phosphate isomerase B